jgi:hypothetical protein
VSKRVILTRGYWITARALAPAGSTTAKKVQAAITAIAEGTGNLQLVREVVLPPVRTCLVQRVRGTAVDIWYNIGDEVVVVYALKLWALGGGF